MVILFGACGPSTTEPSSKYKCTPDRWWAEFYLFPDDISIVSRPRGAKDAIATALEGFALEVGPFEHPGVNDWWTEDDIVYGGKAHISGIHLQCHILVEIAPSFHESALVDELGHYVHEYAIGDADGNHNDRYWWTEVVPRVKFYLKNRGY